MTIASDLGFVVGKEYEVVNVGEHMEDSGVRVGDYALFIKDDGTYYPRFKFNNEEFYANIDPSPSLPVPTRIIPKEKPKMKKEFTKEDLKEGMICILRDNTKCVMFDDTYILTCKNCIGSIFALENFSNSLKYNIDKNYDIMKVYALGELIWEREEKTEQQLQIEKLEATIKQAQEQLKQLKEMK